MAGILRIACDSSELYRDRMADLDDLRESQRRILAGLWALGSLSFTLHGRQAPLARASANLRAMTPRPDERAEAAARALLAGKVAALDDEAASAIREAAEYGQVCVAWRGLQPYHDGETEPAVEVFRSIDRFLLGPVQFSGVGVEDLAERVMRRETGSTMLDLMLALGAIELMNADDFLGYLDEVVEAILPR